MNPAAVKAKATLAIVDSEALNIHPSLAYDNKKAIDKYYNIDPERKQKKERTLQAIQKFNDTECGMDGRKCSGKTSSKCLFICKLPPAVFYGH